MNKAFLAILLFIVSVLSLVTGISLAGNAEKNRRADYSTASSTTVNEAVTVQNQQATEQTSATATTRNTPVATTTAQKSLANVITPSKAKSIALNLAGFGNAVVWDKDVDLDYENGSWIYEVSFEKNNTDYEYVIDAINGNVLYSEVDKY